MRECPCCKAVTDNFCGKNKLCRPCHLLKASTRYRRYKYGFPPRDSHIVIRDLSNYPKEMCPCCGKGFFIFPKSKKYCSELCGRRMNRSRYKPLYKEMFLEKYKAHKSLESAVNRGRIRKPERCESCLKIATLHGHHTDYSRPLFVYWLCPKCHASYHVKDHSSTPLSLKIGENRKNT